MDIDHCPAFLKLCFKVTISSSTKQVLPRILNFKPLLPTSLILGTFFSSFSPVYCLTKLTQRMHQAGIFYNLSLIKSQYYVCFCLAKTRAMANILLIYFSSLALSSQRTVIFWASLSCFLQSRIYAQVCFPLKSARLIPQMDLPVLSVPQNYSQQLERMDAISSLSFLLRQPSGSSRIIYLYTAQQLSNIVLSICCFSSLVFLLKRTFAFLCCLNSSCAVSPIKNIFFCCQNRSLFAMESFPTIEDICVVTSRKISLGAFYFAVTVQNQVKCETNLVNFYCTFTILSDALTWSLSFLVLSRKASVKLNFPVVIQFALDAEQDEDFPQMKAFVKYRLWKFQITARDASAKLATSQANNLTASTTFWSYFQYLPLSAKYYLSACKAFLKSLICCLPLMKPQIINAKNPILSAVIAMVPLVHFPLLLGLCASGVILSDAAASGGTCLSLTPVSLKELILSFPVENLIFSATVLPACLTLLFKASYCLGATSFQSIKVAMVNPTSDKERPVQSLFVMANLLASVSLKSLSIIPTKLTWAQISFATISQF